jgi:hypothetical protein
MSFAGSDRTALIARQWLMTEMEIDGKRYTEAWLERQRQNSVASILQFSKNGSCYVHIYAKGPGGQRQKRTQTNQWQFLDSETKLTIQAKDEPAQTFNIEKITAKKLVLSIKDGKSQQIFTYKAMKE